MIVFLSKHKKFITTSYFYGIFWQPKGLRIIWGKPKLTLFNVYNIQYTAVVFGTVLYTIYQKVTLLRKKTPALFICVFFGSIAFNI